MNCLKCLLALDPTLSHYGLHKACFTNWFKAPEAAEFSSLNEKSTSSTSTENPNQASQNNSFFQGKFKKYSAELNGTSFILKMRENEAPELPEVEYLCNQIGHALEIPVADFYIINFHKELVFVTKNFILPGSPKDLQHIWHYRPDDQHSCEGLIHAITKHTKKPNDVNIFLKMLLFDALIGNNDRHGKNIAFIVTSKGLTLSPIYDNVSYLSLVSGEMLRADYNPTGRINTQATNEPSMSEYVKELKRLGYIEEIKDFRSKINTDQIQKQIQHSFCSPHMKTAITKLINKRLKELDDELND